MTGRDREILLLLAVATLAFAFILGANSLTWIWHRRALDREWAAYWTRPAEAQREGTRMGESVQVEVVPAAEAPAALRLALGAGAAAAGAAAARLAVRGREGPGVRREKEGG